MEQNGKNQDKMRENRDEIPKNRDRIGTEWDELPSSLLLATSYLKR